MMESLWCKDAFNTKNPDHGPKIQVKSRKYDLLDQQCKYEMKFVLNKIFIRAIKTIYLLCFLVLLQLPTDEQWR